MAGLQLIYGPQPAASSLPGIESVDSPLTLRLAGGLPAALGQGTMAQSLRAVLASDQAAIPVNIAAAAGAAGLSIYSNNSLVATGINIKGSAGRLHNMILGNLASSVRHFKFYDKATAPTVGTDTPVLRIAVPANSGLVFSSPTGFAFALGIGVGATTGVADTDTTAPAANDCIINLGWI